MTFKFLSLDFATRIHDEQLAEHGGAEGIRDIGLLESALARPQNKAAYGESDIFVIGAAYLFGIARNHPFVDGNKRTAFACADIFLAMNGLDFDAPQADVVVTVRAVAAGEIDESGIAMWLRDHTRPLDESGA